MKLSEKLFGTHSQRELKRIAGTVDKIESSRPQMQQMSDEELKDQTRKFKERLGRERPWMIFFRRHLPLSARQPSVSLIWSITGYS